MSALFDFAGATAPAASLVGTHNADDDARSSAGGAVATTRGAATVGRGFAGVRASTFGA